MTTPVLDLMASLRSGNSTAPRLTWYGPDAERVELSGRVLDNWVAKTSNLLQDELDAVPGMRLRLDLPTHWKAVVWALSAWQLGLETILDGGSADFLVTADPASAGEQNDAVIAVALPALAMRWPGDLPGGCLDYAAEVRLHGDVFMPHTEPAPSARAFSGADGKEYLQKDLLSTFAIAHEEGVRLHIPAADGLESALANALGAWHQGGSVVLTHADVELTDKLLAAERIHGN
ncbi:TIGR03089 family protein [Arthrobacter sp. MPF02]|uniref:TIGR03089 family protein n=1 Tax=Arthrobacter sp. MPF02 TaxID=3388492 RepID=UPI0039851265